MSYHTATTSIASSAGALIGGFCGGYGYKVAFLTQFILCLVVAGIIYFIVDETVEKKQGKIEVYTKHLRKGNKTTKLNPILSTMMIVMTLVTIATTSYNSTINYYLESVLNMPTMVNGIVMAVAGFIACLLYTSPSPRDS